MVSYIEKQTHIEKKKFLSILEMLLISFGKATDNVTIADRVYELVSIFL